MMTRPSSNQKSTQLVECFFWFKIFGANLALRYTAASLVTATTSHRTYANRNGHKWRTNQRYCMFYLIN